MRMYLILVTRLLCAYYAPMSTNNKKIMLSIEFMSYVPSVSAPKRAKNKSNFNAWIDSSAKEALSILAKKSHRSRTQVLELLILAEAHRLLEESGGKDTDSELYSLVQKYVEESSRQSD